MRGTTAKKLRKAAEVWMKMDSRVTNFRTVSDFEEAL